MKTFERALRRAQLPIDYSKGFNPHPRIIVGLPLSVGITTESDYVDFHFAEIIKPEDFLEIFNKQLPKGIKILDADIFKSKENIMALIDCAQYEIDISFCNEIKREKIDEMINKFLKEEEIIVNKKSKRGFKDVNIRPLIKELELKKVYLNYDNNNGEVENGNIVTLFIKVSAGIRDNLKPELLLKGFENFLGIQIKPINIHRTGIFIQGEAGYVDPLDESVL
jgi:radical SAM-linked protein